MHIQHMLTVSKFSMINWSPWDHPNPSVYSNSAYLFGDRSIVDLSCHLLFHHREQPFASMHGDEEHSVVSFVYCGKKCNTVE